MAVTKRIVCLANSRKMGGRCVAGMEITRSGRVGWVRPVSAGGSRELMDWERPFSAGGDADLLDVIEVPLLRAEPMGCQTENWLVNPRGAWRKISRAGWEHLGALCDPIESLWTNGNSTKNGLNDEIPEEVAATLTSSLRLIHLNGLQLRVSHPGERFGDPKRLQAAFTHFGTDYLLRVTDPVYEGDYLARANGRYPLGESYLTISISEPFNNRCYKLVAAVIEREREGA